MKKRSGGRKIKITNLRKFCSDNGYNQGGFSQLRNKKIERYYEFIAIEPA